ALQQGEKSFATGDRIDRERYGAQSGDARADQGVSERRAGGGADDDLTDDEPEPEQPLVAGFGRERAAVVDRTRFPGNRFARERRSATDTRFSSTVRLLNFCEQGLDVRAGLKRARWRRLCAG